MSREIPVSGQSGLGWFEPGNPANMQLTGSNVEGTTGSAKPAKALQIAGTDGTNLNVPYVSPINSDNMSLGTVNDLWTAAGQMAYNGVSGWDRWRNNAQGTLLASAARTATATSPDQTNYNAKGVQVILAVSLASGTGGLSISIQGKDPVSNLYYTIASASTPITAIGQFGYEVYPGSTTAGIAGNSITLRVSGLIPKTWRIICSAGDGTSYTYSVGYSLNL